MLEAAQRGPRFTISLKRSTKVSAIHKPPADYPIYWVARSKVNNPDQYKKYADLVPGILQKFGGKFLARGGKFKILEGPDKFHRFVVIEFPSFEKAVACHESPEYLEAAAHRKKDGAGELEIVIVESI